jgi:biofilm PGA synthesis N-glycosyltransferase PgaC
LPGASLAHRRSGERRLFDIALSPAALSGVAMASHIAWYLEAVPVFCFGYPFVMSFYWMIGAILFWIGAERRHNRLDKPPPLAVLPPISIIVPCHNESATAAETFGALTCIDYPDFEIIAVNDGSRDNTGEILDQLAAAMPRLRVVHLAANQGKSTAMNVGALLARHELLVLIDGDALLDPHALRWVAWHFRHPLVGGLTGNPRIRNRTSLLGRLQVGEFSSIIGLIKRAQTSYARMYTVSGVICAFRKRAIYDAGGWSPRTLTDDVDITWRVQITGWRIIYAPNVVTWILMPETLHGLWRQRLRWAEGGIQMLLDNARPMLTGRAPSLLPVYGNALVSILWAYCMILTTGLGLLHAVNLPVLTHLPTFSLIPGWYGLMLCSAYLLQASLSLALERRFEPRKAYSLFWIIWYPLAFWMLSATTAAIALPRAVFLSRSARTTWVSPDRGLR